MVIGAKDASQFQTINYTPMFALIVNEVKQMSRDILETRRENADMSRAIEAANRAIAALKSDIEQLKKT